jgi:poly(3-hydroxybutyrate) depolymerase
MLVPLLGFLAGCPVTQSEDTPVSQKQIDSRQGRHDGYWIYVPSNYSPDRAWPLVITLHGTHGWDSASAQIREWKALAQEKGFIVVAPHLRSVQGILPVSRKLWFADMAKDDTAILAVQDEVCAQYRIDRKSVLLTGFSAGGYPLFYTGLGHPERFCMLVAMSCNSDDGLFDSIKLTPEARKMPVAVFWGKDDQGIQSHCWRAVQYLTNHGFKSLQHKKMDGGHIRRPDEVYRFWRPYLPKSQPTTTGS